MRVSVATSALSVSSVGGGGDGYECACENALCSWLVVARSEGCLVVSWEPHACVAAVSASSSEDITFDTTAIQLCNN